MNLPAIRISHDIPHFWFPLLVGLVCLLPWVTAPMALLAGILIGLSGAKAFRVHAKNWVPTLLMIAIVGLGAGMDLRDVLLVGINGFFYTVLGITATFAIGFFLNRFFKINHVECFLIIAGTAICGGSAIAAVAGATRARPDEMTVPLLTVFILNAIGLIAFPVIGHFLHLDQTSFGLWAALAIHDTSSVVGAASVYGERALTVATTVKLTRTLWIVPVAFGLGYWWQGEDEMGSAKARRPWFILGFLIAAAAFTHFEEARPFLTGISVISRRLMVLALFLVGVSFNRDMFRRGIQKTFAYGTTLWVIVATATLLAISVGWIQ